jgi:flagellar hook capping protein FlgD
MTSGYDIEHLFSRYCDTDNGRLAYYFYMMNKVFGSICVVSGVPFLTLDTPQAGRGRGLVDFMKVGDAVMRHGASTVLLGVAHSGRARIGIYDVAGRRVRTLADRVFPAGEHRLTWDGADDEGRPVGRGVYFVKSSTQKDAGRIIVLGR